MAIRTRTGRTLTRLAHIIVVGVLVAACSGASGGSGGIKVSDAWSRPSAMVAGAGAAYMIIENTGSVADALVGGSSPVAATVEVHETYAVEEMPPASGMPAESQGMGGSGMMGMRRIDTLDVPAGSTVELKPGGYHIMLIGLTRELVVGERIEITLTFEEAGDIKVTAEVRGQ